jgi:hypothetical protein
MDGHQLWQCVWSGADDEVIEKYRLVGRDRMTGRDVLLQPGSFLPAYVNDFDRNPMVLNLPDFSQPDVDAGTSVIQPQTNFDEVAGGQLIGGGHLRARLVDFQDAAVGLELSVHSCEHTVDRKIGNGPARLRVS